MADPLAPSTLTDALWPVIHDACYYAALSVTDDKDTSTLVARGAMEQLAPGMRPERYLMTWTISSAGQEA
ncbi:MAG TPA: hypothetical protein VKB57_23785 [Acidimicrobiales bacterium]|nr:hypothetical protein [Acidimicrobiales bacterium]